MYYCCSQCQQNLKISRPIQHFFREFNVYVLGFLDTFINYTYYTNPVFSAKSFIHLNVNFPQISSLYISVALCTILQTKQDFKRKVLKCNMNIFVYIPIYQWRHTMGGYLKKARCRMYAANARQFPFYGYSIREYIQQVNGNLVIQTLRH